jgi:hypothetical protein
MRGWEEYVGLKIWTCLVPIDKQIPTGLVDLKLLHFELPDICSMMTHTRQASSPPHPNQTEKADGNGVKWV